MNRRTVGLCGLALAGAAMVAAYGAAQKVKATKDKADKTAKAKAPKQYKQVGRNMLTQVVEGKAAQAAQAASDYLTADPDDLESMYILAVAHAALGKADQAAQWAAKAVEAGLPIGRFFAGPRKLTAPIVQAPAFRALAEKSPVELIHGPMLGSVTDSRARIWVRTVHEAPFQVLAGTSEQMTDPVRSAEVRTAAARDFTAVAELTGLKPDTRYFYQVLLDGKAVKLDPSPSFRTFPAAAAKARFQVVFGGGAGYTPPHEHMWDTMNSRKPVAYLALGDNVYIDTPEHAETQRYCYYRRQSRPEYRRFVANTPVFSIWDDHDFGDNDCLGSVAIDDPPWKIPVWRVFQENWANPSYGGGDKAPGVWYDFAIDDVHFFMLDCRYYKVRQGADGKPTMLGPVQKKWFLDRLGASKATFKVLASSVPWSRGTKPGSNDTWDGYDQEREEILSFIETNRIEGVFLISADRHRSDAWKTERPGGYTLYEASSSRLTNIHTHPIIPGSLFGYNKTCSFALLTFDTTKADPELTYEVVTIDNEVMHTLPLKRSQLAFQ